MNKLARREAITNMEPELQALVNLVFFNIVTDQFLNGATLEFAMMRATAELGYTPERARALMKSIMEVHYKAQGPLKGFSP